MYRISLHRVHDRIKIVEGSDSIVLLIDADPNTMVLQMQSAHEKMQQALLTGDVEEQKISGMMFADTMFGKEQAGKLLEMYGGDVTCVVNVCLKYFQERLAKLIAKAQKK